MLCAAAAEGDAAALLPGASCGRVLLDPTKPGRVNVTVQNWQGLNAGMDNTKYGSGPVPHSRCVRTAANALEAPRCGRTRLRAEACLLRYVVNNGASCFSFDPSKSKAASSSSSSSSSIGAGSPISPCVGGTVYDDDSVGQVEEIPAERYCLDVAVGGNLETWVGPLVGGRYAVGLLNRSPAAANLTASFEALGLPAASKMDVLDAWSGDSLGSEVSGSVSLLTPSRGLRLLILSPASTAADA
eukprot:SAG31_NODE_2165_length_6281_cov_2.028308_6_plen_243_part_00